MTDLRMIMFNEIINSRDVVIAYLHTVVLFREKIKKNKKIDLIL